MRNLAMRLEDLPGVESVTVDLDADASGGIRVRLEPGADEADVMERVRALLVAYGVRPSTSPPLKVGRLALSAPDPGLGVEVRITPIKGGARVEVIGKSVRSFRIVPPNPTAIAQGVSDAWCQVVGKIPMEVVRVGVDDDGTLSVAVTNGSTESTGSASVADGWESAIARAVGEALGLIGVTGAVPEARLASTAW